jgi:hypothetical protein
MVPPWARSSVGPHTRVPWSPAVLLNGTDRALLNGRETRIRSARIARKWGLLLRESRALPGKVRGITINLTLAAE